MTTAIKRRRGTTTEHATFTGLSGELTIDTTKNTVIVHDGSTAGGFPLAKENNTTLTGTTTLSSVSLNTSTTSDALSITQTGTGNAFVVKDASPDGSPFVIDADGNVLTGTATVSTLVLEQTGSAGIPRVQVATTVGQNAGSNAIFNYNTGGGAIAPVLFFAKSRSGTVNTQSVVSSGDQLGIVSFQGSDGTAFVRAANIRAEVDGTPSTNNMPGRLVFSTTANGASSPTERLRITSAGNVGIGTSSPSGTLDVSTGQDGDASLTANIILGGTAANSRQASISKLANGLGVLTIQSSNSASSGAAIAFKTNASGEAVRITSAGNVGIGTSSTGAKLEVSTGSSTNSTAVLIGPSSGTASVGDKIVLGFKLQNTVGGNTGNVYAAAIAGIQSLSASNSGALGFYTQASNGDGTPERARITSDGDLLVGTTSTIDVGSGNQTGIYQTGVGTLVSSFSNDSWYIRRVGTNGNSVIFYKGINSVGSISVTASTTSYNTSSDYRLKNTVEPMVGALSVVQQLKPVTYKWNADGSDGEGFIAHELAEVVPQCVTGEKDAVDAEGKPVYQGIDTSFLVATLTAAIQEQQALITQLTARLDAANL